MVLIVTVFVCVATSAGCAAAAAGGRLGGIAALSLGAWRYSAGNAVQRLAETLGAARAAYEVDAS